MTLEFQKYVPQSIGVARLLSKKDAADFVSFYLRGRPADPKSPLHYYVKKDSVGRFIAVIVPYDPETGSSREVPVGSVLIREDGYKHNKDGLHYRIAEYNEILEGWEPES